MLKPATLVLSLLGSISIAPAGALPAERLLESRIIHGGPAAMVKSAVDTINLMSTRHDPTNGPGEPHYLGDFENANGGPAWNGWTSLDLTRATESHWKVSNYEQADPANLAAWCGDLSFPACDSTDVAGGYGNAWHEQLEFRVPVPDNNLPATATVAATLVIDTEPGYDFTFLSYQYDLQSLANITSWDGAGTVAVNANVTYLPGEYVDGSDIRLLFRFKSDGGWSDEDCAWPTAGAARVDDITVTISQEGYADQVHFEDFQNGDLDLGDGQGDVGSYLWRIAHPDGVGDFAKIWTGLQDLDHCEVNWSPQVAFIDDGVVVPGTGGTQCTIYCYGPDGYIVNNTGGLAGPGENLHNRIISPVMESPDPEYAGVVLNWLQYQHEQWGPNSPGMFYEWAIRSADTDGDGGQGIQDIADQAWVNDGFLFPPDEVGYTHQEREVSGLLVPGWDQVQVALGVYENASIWTWVGIDGTPAPYFDNVRVKVFPPPGPDLFAFEYDLANDGFPERGSLDFGDLGSHHVRFDMGRNISPADDMRLDFGDSIVVRVSPVRQGAEIHGAPRLHYLMKRNPVFDPYRTAGLPDAGSVAGVPAVHPNGTVSDDQWAFDLPDSGFLFPGDVLHYYVRAEDAIGGADIRASIIPPDTSGFSDFHLFGGAEIDPYDEAFALRALPSIREDGFGGYATPPVLIWNDYDNRGMNKWLHATRVTFYGPGEADLFYTNGASSGVGNGLGGRARSHENLPYTDIIYGSGDLSVHTLSHGDFSDDPSDDVGVLTDWFRTGGKDLFLAGNQLATNLSWSPAGQAFLADVMGVEPVGWDVASFIEDQQSPTVLALAGNPVFQNVAFWVLFGGCPGQAYFDAVQAGPQAQRLAEFADPSGAGGADPYAAGVLHVPATPGTSRVVYTPYDLGAIIIDRDDPVPPLSARALLLRDVKTYFGLPFDPVTLTDTPEALTFAARNHPNPFNPATRIVYTVPRAGHLSLKVYDVRGMLVKTLVDERVEAGADQVAVWDGTDAAGSAVSSGVYFYEVRTGGEVKVGKMALLK